MHPNICPCRTKEPEFFSEHQSHSVHAEIYEELWNFDPKVHRYALEASTGYTKYPTEQKVPERIRHYGIQPHFIYIVRDPFARIQSQYDFLVAHYGLDKATSFTSDDFVLTSNYFLQLEQFRQYFPKKSFLVVDFDDLKNRPQECLDKVYRFLQLPHHQIVGSVEAENRTVSPVEPTLKHYAFLRRTSRLLPAPTRHFLKRTLERVVRNKVLSSSDRQLIIKKLKEDMRTFHFEYGINVSKWDPAFAVQSDMRQEARLA
jgi:Sulfotransferase domain